MWWLLSEPVISGLTLVGIIVLLLYYYGTSTYNFWKLKGIPYIRPKYPFLGNLYEALLARRTGHELQEEYYKYFNDERFGGIFHMRKPTLFLKDPSLIETILIKEFNSFHNRGTTVDIKKYPIAASLPNLDGKHWRSLRTKLNPTFSSVKLKGMHQQLVECSELLVNYIGNYVERDEPVEVREVMAKFTTDVTGSCAFGLNINALKNSDCEFRMIGKKIFYPPLFFKIKVTLKCIQPRVIDYITNMTDVGKFFSTMLKSTMSYRQKNNVVRNDFVQLLMELKKHDEERQQSGQQIDADELIIDDDVITANAIIFFTSEFEATASILSYCLYELSIHPEIQEQAYEHALTILKKHGNDFTCDAIKEMTLINQILAETLRMYPPLVEIRRNATKDYVIPGTNVILPVGARISIPVYSLQHDPKYFPEPEKFKPERFANEKENITKGTYLPFGYGPRVCMGVKFAKMEMQVALVKLLLKYKFTLNPKTITPLKYNPSSILLVPIGGIWLDVHKRI